MLSQHLITKPVFDALFENYSFTQHNPVSASLDAMIELLEDHILESDTQPLEKFYESVRSRAKDIDNAEGKQRIVIELYDKFFKTAFPKTAEALGIVYTPIEVVDFIIKSADAALRAEFGASLSDPGVHILDPFTGTGTFIVRLLQSGLIKPQDLESKYLTELHANEIVLLAYYIAAINIEETYHALSGGDYRPFEGIVLTDTFQMSENESDWDAIFPDNSKRAKRQKVIDIRVIVGNPPYSVGQGSENADNKNLKYESLDSSIRRTYARLSTATNKNSLYDSYIRAFRWASDRIGDKGIICFVSNGSYIDSNAMDGLRKTWADEFWSIYVFNLRGNQRTSGETSRREGGKIFGSGSRTPIAITLIIKNPDKHGLCKIFYRDIGDYLTREQKLEILKESGSIANVPWQVIVPNTSGDWINQRNDDFEKFISFGDKRGSSNEVVFSTYSSGVKTNRDAWAYNFSKEAIRNNIGSMINSYNSEVDRYKVAGSPKNIDSFVDPDPKKISWTVNLKNELRKGRKLEYEETSERVAMYRPFCKQHMYFSRQLNERVYQIPKLFPEPESENLVISVSGIGASKDFSAIITDAVPDIQLNFNGQCFPLYYYEGVENADLPLYGDSGERGFRRCDAITYSFLETAHGTYNDDKITKEDIFYYCYGILHSPEYKEKFASDLKKMLPRLPLVEDFWGFSKAGRELANWHLNYESVEPYPVDDPSESDASLDLRVEKMRFAKGRDGKPDKSVIIYNSNVTLSEIPLEAFGYQVNGKSPIEWIMERYQATIDKDSGIRNDPNSYSDNPRYIIDLLKRIARVSVETNRIVKKLPTLSMLDG